MFAVILAFLTCCFNTLDALLTTFEIHQGLAVEANPIQAYWMENLGAFWAPTKALWVTFLVVILLWHYKENRWARAGLQCASMVYTGAIAIHLAGLFNL